MCHIANNLPNPSGSISCHPFHLPNSTILIEINIIATTIPEKIAMEKTIKIPTNTARVFHVETTWKRSFPRRFGIHVECL